MVAEVNGTQLYYSTHGEGTPMLMMHGGLGLDHSYFPPFFDELGDQVELIYYDHRGNGRSQRPDSWQDITLETFAEDANSLRMSLGHEKIVLFGHSYGGFLAQEYASRFSDTLHGMILCGTPASLGDYPPLIPEWATQLAAFGEIFSRPMADDSDWQQHWNTVWPFYFKEYDPAIAKAIDETTIYSAAALNHGSGLLATFNTKEQLPQITVPTLIIAGRHDFITRAEYSEDMHALLPNSDLFILENSGHYPFIAESDRFMQIVSDWLANIAS